MIEPIRLTEAAREWMRPWLYPIAKTLYEMALERDDEIGAIHIARLANPRDCVRMSTSEQLDQMKANLDATPHGNTYLQHFRDYFQAHGILLEGF